MLSFAGAFLGPLLIAAYSSELAYTNRTATELPYWLARPPLPAGQLCSGDAGDGCAMTLAGRGRVPHRQAESDGPAECRLPRPPLCSRTTLDPKF